MADCTEIKDNANDMPIGIVCIEDWKPYEGADGVPGCYMDIVPPYLKEMPKDNDVFYCGVDVTVRTYREIVDEIAEECRPENLSEVNELIDFFEAEKL